MRAGMSYKNVSMMIGCDSKGDNCELDFRNIRDGESR